jgi:zinc D-Ala-D-Ala carboxypeptidase
LDGITGVTARMAEIENRISAFRTMSTPTSTISTTSTGAASTKAANSAFATALADAKAANGTASANGTARTNGTATTSSAASAGRRNADGVPVDLAAYGNGKIPSTALGRVGTTGHQLWAPAAASLDSLLQAARRDGVKIGITDSYRSYAEQVDLVRRKGLYSQGGLAAKPGTSDHGWGLAVDLDLDSKAQAWMRANGARFGFVEDTPREPWHWAFKAGT